MQAQFNRLLETNPKLKCEQSDRTIGKIGGIFLRRMRMIVFGQISQPVYFYFQPDFASSTSSNGLHFGQLRDMCSNLGLDKKNEFRFRIAQVKVAFGLENLQCSQNRLPLNQNFFVTSIIQ